MVATLEPPCIMLGSTQYPSDALSLDELAYWIAFNRVLGIGPVRFKLLLDFFNDDVAAAWQANSKELAQAGLESKIIESFLKQNILLECSPKATIFPPAIGQLDKVGLS